MGGDLYEAQTLCLDSRNMGAIASETGNLSYYSTVRAPIVERERRQAEHAGADLLRPHQDLRRVRGGRRRQYRVHDDHAARLVRASASPIAPQPATRARRSRGRISPHLAQLAPDLLQWYYDQSHQTGKDYFTLPPSGHLYAYPSSMAEARIRTASLRRRSRMPASSASPARCTGTGSTPGRTAEDDFLPKYATANSPIRGVFPVDVPYSFRCISLVARGPVLRGPLR